MSLNILLSYDGKWLEQIRPNEPNGRMCWTSAIHNMSSQILTIMSQEEIINIFMEFQENLFESHK